MHARRSTALRNPRQHDPPGLRHREFCRPGGGSSASAGEGLGIQNSGFGSAKAVRNVSLQYTLICLADPIQYSRIPESRIPSPAPMHFRTRAIHVGNEPDPRTGAVVGPIHLASTFVQPAAGESGEFDYARSGNPTRKAWETTLASLESGVGALAFSSGMAAIHCVTTLLTPGDQIVAGADIYGGT